MPDGDRHPNLNELVARQEEQREMIERLRRVLTRRAVSVAEGRPAGYERHREAARRRQEAMSRSGRDIAPLPPVANPQRKHACYGDFQAFCQTYFPQVFQLAWSPDHIKVIAKIQQAVLQGGLFAQAMPRGSGKTSLAMAAAIWAVLYGHRKFVCLVAASSERARSLLSAIQVWLETNDRLLEDFPEAIYPIRKLGRIVNRQRGQIYLGQPTRIEWTADKIVLPTIADSAASGGIITTSGLKGSELRGQMHVLADGSVIRPDLAIIDDPQTRDSAYSASQCRQREAIIAGDVLGMAGPGKKIAAILCCTVIRPGDLADTILDHKRHPEWQGERTKILYEFPTRMELWHKYWEIYSAGLTGGDFSPAIELYRENQAEMDAGAVVAWPERYNHDELSAVQHAMNLFFRDQAAFLAEYQNEPLVAGEGQQNDLTADEIAGKINRLPRAVVPIGTTALTAFIDVHQNLLYYCVTAWTAECRGFVVDYGTWPEQPYGYFLLQDAIHPLSGRYHNIGLEGMIYQGLSDLTSRILGKEWRGEDENQVFRIQRCMIDANWGQCTDLIYEFCRRSPHAPVLVPAHGKYIGASSRPIHHLPRKSGDQVGLNWRVSFSAQRHIRFAIYDTNFWKSWIMSRLQTPMGDRGCLSLFGDAPHPHRLFADHLVAEYRVTVTARDRTVDEWKQKPGCPDNHYLDCLVGCAVGASMQGIELLGDGPKQLVSFSELQRQRRMARRQ